MNLALLAPVPPVAMGVGAHWGSEYVSIEFLKALLRHGPFERCLFFVADVDVAANSLAALQASWQGAHKAELHHLLNLPEVLTETPVQALHTLNNFLYRGVAARAQVPGARFPVTASAFQSSTYHGALPEYAQDLICGVWPGDAIATMSETAMIVFQQYYDHLSETALGPWQGHIRKPNVCAIPPGIDAKRYAPVPNSPWRKNLKVPDDAFVVLWLSRLSPIDKADLQPVLRGFREYLEACDSQERPVYLVIVGSDYARYGDAIYRWVNEYGLRERVRGTANLPEKEKPALLSVADCFLALPDNPQESFGYSVLEALACGVPVVAADWNGLRETVDEYVGIRVPTTWGPALDRLESLSTVYWQVDTMLMQFPAAQSVAVDVAAAWRAVDSLRQNPQRCREMSAAARATVLARYAWPLIIAQYVDLWHAAAASPPSEPRPGPTSVWTMPYARAYRHYATHWLERSSRVVRRTGATAVDFDSPYPTMGHLLDRGLLARILAAAAVPMTIDAVIARTGGRPDAVHYHALWLMKQGALQAAPEPLLGS